MEPSIPGLHHVTAITANAQRNLDFYSGLLGLRLVKQTVNYDDPQSYHLYYGDEFGHPGTLLTFFAWEGADRGRIGPPQVSAIALAVPAGAELYWRQRLQDHAVALHPSTPRFGEGVLSFSDPDGLRLEIVATAEGSGRRLSSGAAIPPEYAIRGFHSVTLAEEGHERTARLLTEVMGFVAMGREGARFRYRASDKGELASRVDLLCLPDARRGSMGAGVVHHVAFRTADDEQQQAWRQNLIRLGYNVSPVMDRNYFHSIYYREPGGVLFEIATDPPGFTVDQAAEALGTRLMLPPWLEPMRGPIEGALPPLRWPDLHAQAVGVSH